MIRAVTIALLLVAAAPATAQTGPFPNASDTTALAPDFTGKISYFGNHSGEVITAARGKDNGRTERVGGSLEVELSFEGNIIKGVFKGTGGLRNSTLIGRRSGSTCRLFDATDGSVWTGRCDNEGFVGTVKSVSNAAIQIKLAFETVGTATLDYRAQERNERLAAAEAARTAELLGRIDRGSLADRLDAILQLDARNWASGSYTPGSVSGVKKQKTTGGGYAAYGTFSLGDGRSGWARARIVDDRLTCVEYWDLPGLCRPIDRGGYRPAS